MTQLEEFVESLKPRFRTLQELADQIGMTLSAFSRGLAKGTLNEVNLLRLAKVTGHPPSDVLRLGGKSDVAELIEELYVPSAATLPGKERQLLIKWRALSPNAQEHLGIIIDELVGNRAAHGRQSA